MAILDGKSVSAKEIDSKKHKFIGTFRSPEPPSPTPENPWDVYACPCGQSLWTVQGAFEHWRLGHMDEPQYITIKENAHEVGV